MPCVFETRWFRRHWGYVLTNQSEGGNASWATYEPNWKKIDEVMNGLMADLGEDGWEIKSVVPLVSSRSYTQALTNSTGTFQSAWGAGYGYAAPYVEGVVVLCQRRTEMTDMKHAEWKAAKAAEARRVAEQDAAEKAASAALEARKEAAKAIRDRAIENVSTGLFSRPRFRFDGVEYDDNAAAVQAREEMARRVEEGA